MSEPTQDELLQAGAALIGRDLEDDKVQELLRPWREKVAALEKELAAAQARIPASAPASDEQEDWRP